MDYSLDKRDQPVPIAGDTNAGYQKAETDLLREALKRSFTERFLFATRLYKIQQTFNKAKITHKPFIPKQ